MEHAPAAIRTRSAPPFKAPPEQISKSVVLQSTFQTLRPFPSRIGKHVLPHNELWHILRGLFGRGWWYVSPGILLVSPRRVRQLCTIDEPTLEHLAKIDRWASRLPAMLEEWRVAQHKVIDDEAERRKAEISDSVTRLRLLTIARKKAYEEKERIRGAKKLQRQAVIRAKRGY